MPEGNTTSDKVLLLAYLDRGERAALAELFNRYQDQACAVARHAGLAEPDVEDAAQAAFVEALRALRTFRRETRFAPWFLRIALNVARRKCNSEQQRRRREGSTMEGIDTPAEHMQNPEAAAQRKEAVAQLERFCCAIVSDWKALTLSAVLECPENTFRTWLKRGLDELKHSLSGDDNELTGLLALLRFRKRIEQVESPGLLKSGHNGVTGK